MKKLIVLFAAVLVLAGCGSKTGSKLEETTNIATINGEAVTTAEVFEVLVENGILAESLQVIDNKILSAMYPEDGEEYKAAIDGHIKDVDEYYTAQVGKSLEQLLSENDLTMDEFKDLIKMDVIRELAVSNVIKSEVTDKEIQEAYDQILPDIKASHILITPKLKDDEGNDVAQEVAEARAEEQAKAIIEKLNNGEDFAELAKEYGEDGTKDKGGDLGFFGYTDMVEPFSKAAYELEVGKYSEEPVKTQFGFHVILKTDEKVKDALEDLKEGIVSDLVDYKLSDDKVFNLTLHDIRKDAGLKFEDSKLEEEYNEYIESLKE